MRTRTTTRGVLVSAGAALVAALALLALIAGFSTDPTIKTLEVLAVVCLGAMIIGGAAVLALVVLADWRTPMSDDEFEEIVMRAERLASRDGWGESLPDDPGFAYNTAGGDDRYAPVDDVDFQALVRSALDELPLEFHRALEHVAIVISDGGAHALPSGRGAYGLYQGDTVAHDYFHDRILIFRDTLTRDFGHDSELLRDQVTRTVRHELAHHLGFGEEGVRRLGL